MKRIITYSMLVCFFISCKQVSNTEYKSNNLVATKANFKKEQKDNNISEGLKKINSYSGRITAYLNDPDKSGTNIRKTPNGEVLTKLIVDELNHDYILTLTEAKDGWFKIEGPINGMENDVELPNNKGWIHGSVISVDTRNYNNQSIKLLESPENGKVITLIKTEVIELGLKDMHQDWTKIEYNNYVGWIENKWLCGNPLTNCN